MAQKRLARILSLACLFLHFFNSFLFIFFFPSSNREALGVPFFVRNHSTCEEDDHNDVRKTKNTFSRHHNSQTTGTERIKSKLMFVLESKNVQFSFYFSHSAVCILLFFLISFSRWRRRCRIFFLKMSHMHVLFFSLCNKILAMQWF